MTVRFGLVSLLPTHFCAFSTFILIVSIHHGSQEEELPLVKTQNGAVQGFRYQLEVPPLLREDAKFVEADIFLGIPFAQPPLDGLRLERPLPARNWSGTLDASAIPPACVPQHVLAAPDFSEDCLYLNLFRPSQKGQSATGKEQPFPVLVFIHGGGFCVGGSFVEGFANISNNFITQGILVVTVQYRLNFLADNRIPVGRLLLGWDKSQPRQLGPLGPAACAALGARQCRPVWRRSWPCHCLGPKCGRGQRFAALRVATDSRSFPTSHPTKRLFPFAMGPERASGGKLPGNRQTLGLPWREGRWPTGVPQGHRVGRYGGWDTANEIVRNDFAMNIYNPRADNEIVPGDIVGQALAMAGAKPTLMGFNPDESLFLTIHYPASVFAFDSPLTVADPQSYNRTQLVKFILGCVRIEGAEGSEEAREIANQLESFYAKNSSQNEQMAWRHFLKQYTQFLSDVQFIVPLLAEARLKAARGWPIFLYQFDHVSQGHAQRLPFRAVVHAGEYPYTLGTELFGNYELDEQDRKVQALLLRAYGTFVKHGQPNSPPGMDWPRLDPAPNSALRLVKLTSTKLEVETDPTELTRRIRFWRQLSRLRGFPSISGFPQAVP